MENKVGWDHWWKCHNLSKSSCGRFKDTKSDFDPNWSYISRRQSDSQVLSQICIRSKSIGKAGE